MDFPNERVVWESGGNIKEIDVAGVSRRAAMELGRIRKREKRVREDFRNERVQWESGGIIKEIDVAGVSRRAAGELGRIRKREKES